jgi:hypothetical protein
MASKALPQCNFGQPLPCNEAPRSSDSPSSPSEESKEALKSLNLKQTKSNQPKEKKEMSEDRKLLLESYRDILQTINPRQSGIKGLLPSSPKKKKSSKIRSPFFVREVENGFQLLIQEFSRDNIRDFREFVKASRYSLKTLQGNPSVGYYHSKCIEPGCPAVWTLKKFKLISSPFIIHNH